MQYDVLCSKCNHFYRRKIKFKCEAFPDGIPDKILDGEFVHTKKFSGDNGITFEPIKKRKK